MINGGGGFDTIHGGADGDYLNRGQRRDRRRRRQRQLRQRRAQIQLRGNRVGCQPARHRGGQRRCHHRQHRLHRRSTSSAAKPPTRSPSSVAGSGVVVSLSSGNFGPELGGCAPARPNLRRLPGRRPARHDPGRRRRAATTRSRPSASRTASASSSSAATASTSSAAAAAKTSSSTGPTRAPTSSARFGGDDALTHNGGADILDGGEGSDLFLSVSICDGETIDGGAERAGAPTPDRDNASWARLEGIGVDARIDLNRVGQIGARRPARLPERQLRHLAADRGPRGLEPERRPLRQRMRQPAARPPRRRHLLRARRRRQHPRQLRQPRPGDQLRAGARPGGDRLRLDRRPDPGRMRARPRRRRRRIQRTAAAERTGTPRRHHLPPPPKDRKPPRTKLLRHPPKLLRVAPRQRKLVAFRFAASENSRFRCKLDRKPYASCRSPRKYRVRVGRHVFRLFAIDAAGNRDRTPAAFVFRVVAKQPPRPASAAR